jgi:hypothetical protein
MKIDSLFYTLLFVMLVPASGGINAQNSWYVSPTGTDGSGFGSSPLTPFATLPYAVDNLLAGDTLNVMEGIYYNSTYGDGDRWKNEKTITISNLDGSADAYTVIRPYQDDEVILRGDGIYIFHVRNCSYLRVEGFEIEGEVNNIPLDTALAYQFAYRYLGTDEILYRVIPGTPAEEVEEMTFPVLEGIERPSYTDTKGFIAQLSHHLVVKNNHIHHAPGTGLRFNTCSYVRAEGNEVDNCSRRSYSGTHAFVFEGTQDLDQSTDTKVWIMGNHIHDNYNEIYSWAPTKTIITPVIDEGKGISLQRNDAERGWELGRMLVANNLTHNNGFSGMHVNTCRGVDFVNNTSYLDHRTGGGRNHGISMQSSTDIRIVNNIVYHDESLDGFGIAASSNSSNYLVTNNLVNGRVDDDIAQVATNTLIADPLFADVDNNDFRLAAGSPAIGAADASFAPATEYTGGLRDGAPDLGAYEFGISTDVGDIWPMAIAIHLYPNPCGDYLRMDSDERLTEVLLYDALGRPVTCRLNRGTSSTNWWLDTSGLHPGIYFLKAGFTTKTFIKQ